MVRRLTQLFLVAVTITIHAFAASGFTPPTPEELTMTSDPAAPGAMAVYLLREETADDQRQMHTLYARTKILTDAGREKFSDIVIPYEDKEEHIEGIEARTIHSDGKVIRFTGKPWQKEVVRARHVRYMEKGFSMPDVQVGSIVEYRYETTYNDWWAPRWHIQQPVPVRHAHYHFVSGPGGSVYATRFLPANAQVVQNHKGWDLVLDNVPPLFDEDDSPPLNALGYHVLFYYVHPGVSTADQFWQQQGQIWSAGVDEYCAADKLKPAVSQIVAPGDTDDQKLRKIYAAVMKIENTDFSRESSKTENKAENLKFRNAADIWQQQRGNDREITMVFLGLVRAAGFKAWAMFVTDRDHDIFRREQLDWDQLDDEIVIVNVGGKEMLFDPGERLCEFGKLHWSHTWTMGVRQTDKGTEIADTPFPRYSDTTENRQADLSMDSDGSVHGSIRISMTGSIALRWRQTALQEDEEAAKKKFGDELQPTLPSGVTAKANQFTGLTDSTQPLVATFDVSGTLASTTGKRMFLPATFFEANAKPRFVNATRTNSVYLHYSWTQHDEFRLKLPSNATVEALPADAHFPLAPNADFVENYRSSGGTYQYGRLERIAGILYQTKDYPELRDFFQKINTQDQAQVILKLAPVDHAAVAPAN